MNINNKIGVTGKYIFHNKGFEVKNKITDWGMARLAGHGDHLQWAVAENFHYLFLGASNESEDVIANREEYSLIDPHYERTYSSLGVGTIDIRHASDPKLPLADQDATKTKTEVITDPATGNIIIRFHQTFVVYFHSDTTIGEVGVGGSYYKSGSGTDTYPGYTSPVASVGTCGYVTNRTSEYGKNVSGYDFATRTDHQNNIKYSIFSRATINPKAIYSAGAIETVTYVCEFSICKDVAGFLPSLALDIAGATVDLENQFPSNKTFTAQVPFYRLNQKRLPIKTDGFTSVESQAYWTGYNKGTTQAYSTFNTKQPVPPLFESMAFPPGGNLNSKEARGEWFIDLYSNPALKKIGTYNTATPTMSTYPWDIQDSSLTPISDPVTALLSKVTTPPITNTPQYTFRSPATTTQRISNPSANTWTTEITFRLRTNDLGSPPKVGAINISRLCNSNNYVKDDWRGFAGIYTMFETPWTPPTDRLLQLAVTFTWTRN